MEVSGTFYRSNVEYQQRCQNCPNATSGMCAKVIKKTKHLAENAILVLLVNCTHYDITGRERDSSSAKCIKMPTDINQSIHHS